jgi:hypothetical protein
LLEPLLASGKDGHTLVVLTSDHGEGLGEHGEQTHGIFAYETTLHVPLILYAPRLFGPRATATRVRHVDILPTVLDALGLPAPADVSGRSLLALANGTEGASDASYFEALSSSVNRGWAPLTGLAQGQWKLIDLPLPELYDLEADPHETRNLAATRTSEMETLRARLARMRSADRGTSRTDESAETRERLRSLGYASASAPVKARYTQDDDPKRLIGLDAAVTGLGDAVPGRRRRGRARAHQGGARAASDMPLALQHLAFLQRQAAISTAPWPRSNVRSP